MFELVGGVVEPFLRNTDTEPEEYDPQNKLTLATREG